MRRLLISLLMIGLFSGCVTVGEQRSQPLTDAQIREMATGTGGVKISELTAITSAASDDVLAIVDTSENATRKITAANLALSISGAPEDATYITQTADGTLSAEQALSALATGIVKNTTTTGVLSIAADGTDYLAPTRIDDTKGNGDTTYVWSADKVFDQLALKAGLASPALTGSPTIETSIDPDTADGATIGSASKEWAGAYFADGAVLYFQNDQSSTVTSSADGLTFNKFPMTPSAAPDANYEVANKKYVDDTASAFDSTTVDATTWSDGANASNIWTFDVSGTDHTMTAGNGLMTFSHAVTISGTVYAAGFTADPANDPATYYDPLTASESEWWTGPNHDGVGDDNDPFEIRQSATAGTNVRMSIDTTGETTIAGTAITESGTEDFILKGTRTLNDSGAPDASEDFIGILVDITATDDTGWDETKLIDLRTGGTSKFEVDLSGNVVAAGNFDADSYGSDGSVSDAELLFINTLSTNVQAELNKILEAGVEETLTKPWNMYSDRRVVHTSSPSAANVRPGDRIWVDSVTYDPSGETLGIDLEVMLTEDVTELIEDQVDRDFSGASDWTNSDINAYDESTDLTITASAAGQYCSLAGTEAVTVSGKWYVLQVDVANLVSTWTIKDADGNNTIGTISADGDAQKFYYIANDSTGGIRLVSVASDSSADLDDFSLHYLPWISWADEAGNRYVNQYSTVETEILPIAYATDGTTAPAAADELTSTNTAVCRAFDKDANEDVKFVWHVPADIDATSGIKFRFIGYVGAATAPANTEVVAFSLAGCSVGNSDLMSCAVGTAQTSSLTADANYAQYDRLAGAWSDAITITNLAASESVHMNLIRLATTTDTYAQDFHVNAIELKYKRTHDADF